MITNDTIAAPATPAGTGAVSMVRISGPEAISVAERIFAPYQEGKALARLPGYSGLLGRVLRQEEPVDEAVAFVYRAPKSYTGEDCVELSCHGSPYILEQVLECCISAGARPAQPGEFTQRAFFNGKMNLSQAEAVGDLIAARSESARRAALSAKDGVLSRRIGGYVQALSSLSAHLAAWSDYPDEDLEPVDPTGLSRRLSESKGEILALLDTYGKGKLLREGVETAIVGKPNVGKSTLMNLLSGRRRSIVTDIPGTTRDIVEETVRIGDYLLRLMDTAGIRATDDVVEQQGVALSRQQIESAQLVLAVFDSSLPLDASDLELLGLLQGNPACIAVVNKTDLEQRIDIAVLKQHIQAVVFLSADHGEGKDDLEAEIVSLLGLDSLDPSAAMVANQRQRFCLGQAVAALDEGINALEMGMTLDAVNVCVDDALEALLILTGERATEKVVEQVFANFCVGK